MKPILFSGPMVQAILAGRKTQTRRLVKNWDTICIGALEFIKPKYSIGDILWVRETHVWVMLDHAPDLLEGSRERTQWVYKASIHEDWMKYAKEKYGYKWVPSIFMPKDACRIYLRVTGVQLQRIQDITDGDALSEGTQLIPSPPEYLARVQEALRNNEKPPLGESPRQRFQRLWFNINGPKSWDQNAYVWVYTFEVITKP